MGIQFLNQVMEEISLLTFQKELHFEIRTCQLGMEGLVEYDNFTRLSVRHKKNIISFIFYQKILYQFIYKKKKKINNLYNFP